MRNYHRHYELRMFRVKRLLLDERAELYTYQSTSRLGFLLRECAGGKSVEEAGAEYEDLQRQVRGRLQVIERRIDRVWALPGGGDG